MIQDLSAKLLIQFEHTYFVTLFVTFLYKWLENKHIYEINVTKPKPDAGLLRRTHKRKKCMSLKIRIKPSVNAILMDIPSDQIHIDK